MPLLYYCTVSIFVVGNLLTGIVVGRNNMILHAAAATGTNESKFSEN